MKEKDIKVGTLSWFDGVPIEYRNWKTGYTTYTYSFSEKYKVQRIDAYNGEKYLIMKGNVSEYGIMLSFLYKKGLLEKDMYTIEQLKKEKIAIRCTQSEANVLSAEAGENPAWQGREDRMLYISLNGIFSSFSWNPNDSVYREHNYAIIDYNQVILERIQVGDRVVPIKYPFNQYNRQGDERSPIRNFEEHAGDLEEVAWIEGEYWRPKGFVATKFKLSDFRKEDKQTNMKTLFTVGGSIPLKKALLEELKEAGLENKFTEGLKIDLKDNSISDNIGIYYEDIGYPVGNAEVHYSLPAQYNEAIEAFKQYFKEEAYKKGDLVTDDDGNNVYTFKEYKNGGVYIEEWTFPFASDNRLATPEEISLWKQKKLIEEAKKRGFKKGIRYVTPKGTTMVALEDTFTFDRLTKDTIDMGSGAGNIYASGVWAEIVPQEVSLTIGSKGAKVVVGRGTIKSQSLDIDYNNLKRVNKVHTEHININDSWKVRIANLDERIFIVGCSTEDNRVSLNEIRKVLTEYDKLNKHV